MLRSAFLRGKSATTAGHLRLSSLRMASGRRPTAQRRTWRCFSFHQRARLLHSSITAAGLSRGVCEMRVVRGSNDVNLMKIISPAKQHLLYPSLRNRTGLRGLAFPFFETDIQCLFCKCETRGFSFPNPKVFMIMITSLIRRFGSIFSW